MVSLLLLYKIFSQNIDFKQRKNHCSQSARKSRVSAIDIEIRDNWQMEPQWGDIKSTRWWWIDLIWFFSEQMLNKIQTQAKKIRKNISFCIKEFLNEYCQTQHKMNQNQYARVSFQQQSTYFLLISHPSNLSNKKCSKIFVGSKDQEWCINFRHFLCI